MFCSLGRQGLAPRVSGEGEALGTLGCWWADKGVSRECVGILGLLANLAFHAGPGSSLKSSYNGGKGGHGKLNPVSFGQATMHLFCSAGLLSKALKAPSA